jgi:hypothetical protein
MGCHQLSGVVWLPRAFGNGTFNRGDLVNPRGSRDTWLVPVEITSLARGIRGFTGFDPVGLLFFQ